MRPLVSVLVLAYNHEEFIAETLASILKQRCDFDLEVLVGEDCSTDGTRQVVEDFALRHPDQVRLVTSQANVGMHENLHRLVHAARGEYLAFCEGDDYWNHCTKLADQVAFLRAHPDHGAVHTEFDHIARVGSGWRALRRFWDHHGVRIPEGDVFEQLVVRNVIQTCTLIVRADLARAYVDSPFAGRYRIGDWPLCLFVSLRSSIGYLEQPTATYRRVEGSATNRGLAADIARARDHMEMADDFCKLAGAPAETRLQAHAAAMRVVLDRSLRLRDVTGAREALAWLDGHDGQWTGWRARLERLLLAREPGMRLVARRRERQAQDDSAYRFDPYPAADCR